MPKIKDIATGEIVEEIDYGLPNAEEIAIEKSDNMPGTFVDYAPGGEYNGMDRMETNFAGSGKTGYNKIGMNPHIPKPIKKEY